MNIGGYIPDATNCYDGVAFEIYVAGCTKRCKGCHNPELQDFNAGDEVEIDKLIETIDEYRGWFDIIAWLGGDLLDQDDAEEYARKVKAIFPNYPMYLFTGEELEAIPQWCYEVFDWIKYGPYIEELKQEGFPASSNQGIIELDTEVDWTSEKYLPFM